MAVTATALLGRIEAQPTGIVGCGPHSSPQKQPQGSCVLSGICQARYALYSSRLHARRGPVEKRLVQVESSNRCSGAPHGGPSVANSVSRCRSKMTAARVLFGQDPSAG